jgi:hypothetical protein
MKVEYLFVTADNEQIWVVMLVPLAANISNYKGSNRLDHPMSP